MSRHAPRSLLLAALLTGACVDLGVPPELTQFGTGGRGGQVGAGGQADAGHGGGSGAGGASGDGGGGSGAGGQAGAADVPQEPVDADQPRDEAAPDVPPPPPDAVVDQGGGTPDRAPDAPAVEVPGEPVMLASGLELHWQFDEPSGTSATDSTGNGHHAYYTGDVGAPSPVPTVPTVSFDDPRSRVFVSSYRQMVLLQGMPLAIKRASAITISLWYRSTAVDSSGSEVISLGDTCTLRLNSSGGVKTLDLLRWITTPAGTAATATREVNANLLDGKWHHVAAISTGSYGTLVVDGAAPHKTNTDGFLVYEHTDSLVVGRQANPATTTYDFDGHIDDVRIYTRALNASELAALAQGRGE